MQKSRHFFRISIFIFCFLLWGCDKESIPTLTIGNTSITVEIANTPMSRYQGLSDRLIMEENHGMLFVFQRPEQQSFCMRKCHFDIDLAYISSDGVIQEIIHMKKEPYNTPNDSLKTYTSQSANIQFVLEMNKGWFSRHSVKVGDKIDLTRYKTAF